MKHTKFLAFTAMALAASTAMAESSVTLYGTLDASVAYTKSENSAWNIPTYAFTPTPTITGVTPQVASKSSKTSVSSGTMGLSFIGLKGTEDLGNGMEAQFVLESLLDLDTGAQSGNLQNLSATTRISPLVTSSTWNARDEGGFWSRNAYVGLKTNYGLIRLGQMENLGYLSGVKWNPFGDSAVNTTTRVFYGTDYYARSWSNTIAYYLKSDGLIFALQYAPKNDSSSGAGGAKMTAALSYTAGPFSGSIGIEDNKDNVAASASSPAGAAPAQAKSIAVHGSYDLGVAKLFAEYGTGKLNREAATAQDVKSTGYQLGASVPVGNGTFLASFAHGVQKADNTASFAAGTKFRDVKVFALGYDHSLSKRTDLYAVYSNDKEKYPVTSANGAAGGLLNNLEFKTDMIAFGVRHRF